MITMGTAARRGAFALATAAALGFGGAQAFASPNAPAEERVCNGAQCREYCRSIGYDDGRCNQGTCGCLFVVPPAR